MQPSQEAALSKVKDLGPATKQVSLIAKVVSIGERRTIESKFGSSRTLCEAVVGDETGTVILTLWEAQIGQVAAEDIVRVNNGYVSLVRGRIRLNVGKYGSLEKVTQDVPEVNRTNDVSAAEHDAPPRESRGYGGPPGGGSRAGYGGRSGGGRRTYSGRPGRNERRIHGRRRF